MLSLILPTYNEAANIGNLLEVLDGVLVHIPHEIIVVDDDSPDKTWKVATEFSKRRGCIKVIRRIGKKGLSSAVLDGFDAAHGTILAVMDADGQHDSALLPTLVSRIEQCADISTGSRYVPGGSVGSWVADRRIISTAGTFVAKLLSRVPVSDPLGGFFVMKRSVYRNIRSHLRPTGFKILLEILAAVPKGTKLIEEPLVFRMRLHGQSKLSLRVHIAFLCQILRLAFGRFTQSLLKSGMALFVALMIGAALTLIPRVFALRFLYTDAPVRPQVQSALVTVADREGWLLSDIRIIEVLKDSISIIHADHLRFQTPARSCKISLPDTTLSCAE